MGNNVEYFGGNNQLEGVKTPDELVSLRTSIEKEISEPDYKINNIFGKEYHEISFTPSQSYTSLYSLVVYMRNISNDLSDNYSVQQIIDAIISENNWKPTSLPFEVDKLMIFKIPNKFIAESKTNTIASHKEEDSEKEKEDVESEESESEEGEEQEDQKNQDEKEKDKIALEELIKKEIEKEIENDRLKEEAKVRSASKKKFEKLLNSKSPKKEINPYTPDSGLTYHDSINKNKSVIFMALPEKLANKGKITEKIYRSLIESINNRSVKPGEVKWNFNEQEFTLEQNKVIYNQKKNALNFKTGRLGEHNISIPNVAQ